MFAMPKLLFFIGALCITYSATKKFDDNNKPDWAKKDIRDFSEADMER